MYETRERFAEVHIPCPCGKSSDAYCVRQDGSGYCFSCGQDFQDEKKEIIATLENSTFELKPFRGISRSVVQFYDVETKVVDGVDFERGFPFGGDAAKVKNVENKKLQHSIGEFQKAGLFGQDKFDKGSKEGIIITEGEEDAMAAYEMMRFRFASVSLKSGSQSTRDLSRRDIWDYVNSFDRIYICFDNDEQGKNATRALAGIFDFRKTYHVQLSRHKDANDYLKAGESDDFERTVRAAKRYAPDNIISSFSDIEKALDESGEEMVAEYPFPQLQEMTYGMHEGEVVVVKAPEGVGKQLPITTRVPTPNGWRFLEDLQVGDYVYDEQGQKTIVTYVTPVQHGVPCYELTFNDGTKQVAGGPHRWGVYDSSNKYLVKTTEEMFEEGCLIPIPNGYSKARYSVPLVKPIQYGERNLPIDPYLLGYWLGDGHSYSADICVGDQDIHYWNECKIRKERTAWVVRHPNLTFKQLRENNLIKNKHIPNDYLIASEDQRRNLLKGLLDSDGNGSKTGVEFYTKNENLAKQVIELTQSLGYAPRLRSKMSKFNGKEYGSAYTVWFLVHDGFDVFTYERKAKKTRKCKTTRLFKKAIRKIEPVESVPSICIQVDSPNHLYVVENYLVTHNTEFLRALEYHVLKTTGHPIGIIHLEETNSTTIKALAGYELGKPATLPEYVSGLSKQDILLGYRKAVNDDEGRVHIHSSFDVEDEESFYGSIRFLVSSAGCRVLYLDHISWLATGMNDDDERKKLDRISQRLKLLAKELKFCLIEVSHVNDDGLTRGSRNISKVGNTVLSLSRDLKAGDNVTGFVLEKVRLGGRTGPAGFAYFNRETGRLEANQPDPILEEG